MHVTQGCFWWIFVTLWSWCYDYNSNRGFDWLFRRSCVCL